MFEQQPKTLRRLCQRYAVLLALVVAAFTLSSSPARAQTYHSPMHIGVRCQQDFQDTWLPTISAWAACSGFNGQITRSDYLDFYFNLHGAAPAFTNGNAVETCNGCGGVDSVDFFVMYTHGGIAWNAPTYADYAMWDNGSIAWVPDWRLGSTGKQVKVLSTYSCDTLKTSDGDFWARWYPAFAGGLKILTGGHDLLWDNTSALTNYAQRMQNGEPIGSAWLESLYYADNRNAPSEANTGANPSDCWNRAGATMQSVQGLAPLRDGQIGYMCWVGWNGD